MLPPVAHNAKSADSTPPRDAPHRVFELPTIVNKPVRQTIVQVSTPPDILLKLNAAAKHRFLDNSRAPSLQKAFSGTDFKEVQKKVAQNLPATPRLELPNSEPSITDLKLSAALVSETPRLLVPPATTAPVRMPGPAKTNEVPQIVMPDSNLADAAALIALVDSPVRNGIVIVPPANQVGAAGPSGRAAAKSGSRQEGQSSAGGGNPGQGNGDSRAGGGTNGSVECQRCLKQLRRYRDRINRRLNREPGAR